MSTIFQLLIGKKVRFLEECDCEMEKGKAFEIEVNKNLGIVIHGENDLCDHLKSWELIGSLKYKSKSHRHAFLCECGAKK